MTQFLPQIVETQEADSQRESERRVRRAINEALHIKAVAEAIAPFKCNGVVTGHRTLDDDRAVAALLKQVPDYIRATINAQRLTAYRLIQIFNQVLRREFEMEKGKLTGNRSPAKLKKLAQQTTAALAQQQQAAAQEPEQPQPQV